MTNKYCLDDGCEICWKQKGIDALKEKNEKTKDKNK